MHPSYIRKPTVPLNKEGIFWGILNIKGQLYSAGAKIAVVIGYKSVMQELWVYSAYNSNQIFSKIFRVNYTCME